jgi:hypothetical protein
LQENMKPTDVNVWLEVTDSHRTLLEDMFVNLTTLFLKEPLPIRTFLALWAANKHTSPEEVAEVFVKLAVSLDGHAEKWVHKQISRRRVKFFLGSTSWLKSLGIIKRADGGAKRLKTHRGRVTLGQSLLEYDVFVTPDVVGRIGTLLKKCASVEVPTLKCEERKLTSTDVKERMLNYVAWMADVPSFLSPGGPTNSIFDFSQSVFFFSRSAHSDLPRRFLAIYPASISFHGKWLAHILPHIQKLL